MTRDATLAQRCRGCATPAPSPARPAAPRSPQFPGSCHQTPARPSSQSLYDRLSARGKPQACGDGNIPALVPAVLTVGQPPVPLSAALAPSAGEPPDELCTYREGDLLWPGLGGPAGLWLQILVGQHLAGLKAPTPTAAHGTPERHILVMFRGRAQQAEGGMVPPKAWREGHWGVIA